MGDFLASLFGGSNPTLGGAVNNLGSLGQFSSNTGQNATNSANAYYSAILSGDPARIAQTLAPEISANSEQAQQQKQTMGEFGGRSGGNTAAANNIDANSRANIVNLIGGTQQGAAQGEGNLGTANLNLAGTDLTREGQLSQEQHQNQIGSILGGLFGGLGGNLGQIITGGLGHIPGLSGVI